jgi:perosamine synthetase
MADPDHQRILDTIRSCLPAAHQRAELHEPLFAGNEWKYVKECIDTGWVSTAGEYVGRFERMLEDYTGAGHAIATVNGTAALHICLLVSGVRAGDEVLIPSLTFIATANAVSYCGAIPHLVESEERTLGLDPAALAEYLEVIAEVRGGECVNRASGRVIRAVMPMHTFGHPVDLDPLLELCAKFGIVLVEDAAESLGARYKGRQTGNFGMVAGLSFNGNKTITTGGGGAILTNDAGIAGRAKHLATTARIAAGYEFIHDEIGYNYRMPNINAALGVAQLEQLPQFVARKRRLAAHYAAVFREVPGVSFFTEAPFAESNYWLNALLLDEADVARRNALLDFLNANGIGARPVWKSMHELPIYAGCPRMELDQARKLAARIVNIPSSVFLSD